MEAQIVSDEDVIKLLQEMRAESEHLKPNWEDQLKTATVKLMIYLQNGMINRIS